MVTWFEEVRPQGADDVARSFASRETPLGEYLGAKVTEGFDYTTTGRFMDERRIRQAEEEAYGRDTRPAVDSYDMAFADPGAQANLTRSTRPVLTKKQWIESEHFRPSIDFEKAGEMTPVRAQILAEDFDKRRYRDSLIERSPTGMRSILGFGAAMLGSLPDPVNLIGFGGVAAGRTLGKAALIGAAENVAATTLADAVVLPDLAARGEKVGFQEFVMDNMFAAAIGGLFGLGGQALKNATSTARLRAHMTERQTLAGSLEKAVADVAEGRPVDVREVLRLEKEALGRLYDEALVHPLGGDPHNPQVRLAFAQLADELDVQLGDILVDRGSGKLRPSGEIKTDPKFNFGMVKFIYKHGEGSHLPEKLHVTKDDILSFPEILRDYMPDYDPRYGSYQWVVEREDGRRVMYVAKLFEEDQAGHLATVHVLFDDKAESRPLSQKIGAGPAPEASSQGSRLEGDTAEGALSSPTSESGAASATEKNITTDATSVKGEVTPHRAAVESALAPFVADAPGAAPTRIIEEKPQAKPGVVQFGEPKPERFAEPKEVIQRAEQSPEMSQQAMHAQIEAMRDKGQLRGVDHFELQEAGAATERAERYGEHLLNIAECAAKVAG